MNLSLANISIRWKIFGAIALVITGALVFQQSYLLSRQLEQLTNALEAKATSTARIMTHQLIASIEFADKDRAKEILRGSALDSDFVFAAVFDPNGELMAYHGIEEAEAQRLRPSSVTREDSFSLRRTDQQVLVTAPVITKAGTCGTLRLALSLATVHNETIAIRRASLTIGIIIGLIGIAIAFAISASIGRRLGRIAGVMETVGRGDLTHEPIKDTAQDEVGRMAAATNSMLSGLRQLEAHVTRVAEGDLSLTSEVPGDLASAFNRMIVSQRDLVKQISETALQVNATSGEFFANAQQQERGATEQSSSIAETQRTMESLLGSGVQINKSAQNVLQNAERAQQNSQVVAERIAALSHQSKRIGEILDVIKDIANKSDLLALNAALEGTKAGEAGRGFSLVATQMQRLAESVMGSVRDIKELTAAITEATQSAVFATEESTKISDDTTRSARQIALTIQQQQTATEEVTKAMDDVTRIAKQTAAGSKEIVTATTDLMKLSERLQTLVGRFVIDPAGGRRQS
jgi:methyl-accepting chemotaxis protein